MVRAHVRCDNARAWASALSHVHAQNHGITDLSHLHACRPSTSQDISCWMLGIQAIYVIPMIFQSENTFERKALARKVSRYLFSKCIMFLLLFFLVCESAKSDNFLRCLYETHTWSSARWCVNSTVAGSVVRPFDWWYNYLLIKMIQWRIQDSFIWYSKLQIGFNLIKLPHLPEVFGQNGLRKQCRHWSDTVLDCLPLNLSFQTFTVHGRDFY